MLYLKNNKQTNLLSLKKKNWKYFQHLFSIKKKKNDYSTPLSVRNRNVQIIATPEIEGASKCSWKSIGLVRIVRCCVRNFGNAAKIPRRADRRVRISAFLGGPDVPDQSAVTFLQNARAEHPRNFILTGCERGGTTSSLENNRSKTMTDANEVARSSLGVPRARGEKFFLRYL